MDMIVRVDHLPLPGETVMGGGFQSAAGGKGANQATAAALLGAQVKLIGCVGDDVNGRRLLALARASRVGVTGVRRLGEATGVALILVEEGGHNQIAVAPGANSQVTPEMITASAKLFRWADVAVAQLEVPLETVSAAAYQACSAGIPFMLNAAPARSDLASLLHMVTVLVVNETELAAVLGQEVRTGEEGIAASQLLARGPRAVVVTLGERGSVLADQSGCREIAAYPVQPVDTTAAGDAFVGALAAHYRGIESLEEAARYASAAGAIACTRPGAQPSLPGAAEVESLLRSAAQVV
jgi:ribokinase